MMASCVAPPVAGGPISEQIHAAFTIAPYTDRMDRNRSKDARSFGRRALASLAVAAGLAIRPASTAWAQQPTREGDLDGKPVFLPLDRIVVSIFRGKTVERHDMLLIKLELINPSAITPVEQAMPRLRDTFVKIWNRLGSRPDAADRALDIEAGRRSMQAACDEMVGPGQVKAVLIVGRSSRLVRQQPGMRS